MASAATEEASKEMVRFELHALALSSLLLIGPFSIDFFNNLSLLNIMSVQQLTV